MNKITLFEHDKLLLSHEYMDQSKLDSLLRFNEIHGNKYFEGVARGIRVKQYVGVIQIDGLLIEILPKTDKNREEVVWQNALLQMLVACNKVKAQSNGSANLQKQNINLLEVYFEYFLRELEVLIHSGLVKKYRKEIENVKALKGKLDFAGNIRHNLIHKERFYTVHQVYDVNHRLHQVLTCALNIVDRFSTGTSLSDVSKRLKMSFPEVDSINVNNQILSSIKLDRKTAPYERALELARLIILNYSPDINGGNEKMISILFDMNQLWEEYVLVMLRKAAKLKNELRENPVPETEIKILGKRRKTFWSSNYIEPDVVLERGNETFIIDTKWKQPGNTSSIQDLRQMYAYARFWKAKECLLLYPGVTSIQKSNNFLTDDYHLLNDNHEKIEHYCKMGFVSVILNNILDKNIGNEILEMFFSEKNARF